ncbi:17558_t:CDS:2 [Racocetra persica]|uniref:17558_t:CDS:1 n=1 Tax=Racocetra persica TaxID=160502 RepID=A0ACA9MCB1_9GLOM|nr:17558_t:CDS:2 [Racocetra persica]
MDEIRSIAGGQKVLSKYHRQDEFLMNSGKKIFIEWLALNRDNPSERVLFDNHYGKGPHYHENNGKIESVEPHIVRSNSIEAFSTNMTKNRLLIFATLVEKKPTNLTELAHLLQKDYALVRRETRILEGMGLIKLEKVSKETPNQQGSKIKFSEIKPIALYKRIIFDFPILKGVPVEKTAIDSRLVV